MRVERRGTSAQLRTARRDGRGQPGSGPRRRRRVTSEASSEETRGGGSTGGGSAVRPGPAPAAPDADERLTASSSSSVSPTPRDWSAGVSTRTGAACLPPACLPPDGICPRFAFLRPAMLPARPPSQPGGGKLRHYPGINLGMGRRFRRPRATKRREFSA